MKRVRRKGGNKEKVFGCDLPVHLNASSQEIPQVLRCCSEFVETHGIVDGIYRLSGVSSNTQKLRAEFECDGSPDLNKDLYLQDIHCVSSLCKAYFRELPNPLLTYQLYDKFAEAVSIQLEEETLEKIRDILRELPAPHYRTLEFLMRHLDRMASFSSETNMHARNLAIVWAPNLLRSKEIEVSGLNGKTAFMEVRVQSIVVEFILTHVPQLFPEPDVSFERRTSLPFPTAACNQEEGFLKSSSTQRAPSLGKLSPIRSRHEIIEGTEKRKGSLKGRKWMSIFNIGGRLHDRRHKHSSKEKDRPALRPARSMDSLSTPLYPKEGSLRIAQIPPSTDTSTSSPLVIPSPLAGPDVTASSGGKSGSEYAVTYRRGTGLVSGGLGTQGIYTALHPEGFGVTGNETLQLRSPGLTTKGRRAAMHITGPTRVTVPLHITSNLAFGALQGGGGDRIIHCGSDKDEGRGVEGKREGQNIMRKGRRMEWNVDDCKRYEEERKNHRGKVTDAEVVGTEGKVVEGGDGGDDRERQKEEQKDNDGEEWRWKPEVEAGGLRREQRVKSLTSSPEEENDEDDVSDGMDVDGKDEYMDMKGPREADGHSEVNPCGDDLEFDPSNIFNSTEGDDQRLSGYVQDNFEFLDQMDCSTLDHLDYSVPYQVNEFSVEPPCHSDDEYEVMAQVQASDPAARQTHLQPGLEEQTQSHAEPNPKMLLSVDSQSRHCKSLSLPHMTSPIHGPEESYFEEEEEDDSDNNDYSSEDDESLFVKSLPTDFILSSFCRFEPDTDAQDSCGLDRSPVQQLQISGGRECQTKCYESPARKESTAGGQEQVEVKAEEDDDRPEEKEPAMFKEEEDDDRPEEKEPAMFKEEEDDDRPEEKEPAMFKEEEDDDRPEEKELAMFKEEEDDVCEGRDQLENKSRATEEDQSAVEDTQSEMKQPPSSEASTHVWADYPLPGNDDSSATADTKVEQKEVVDNQHGDYQPRHAVSCGQKEIADPPFQGSRDFAVSSREQTQTCDREDTNNRDSNEGEDMKAFKVIEDSQEIILEITDNDQNIWEETEDCSDVIADIKPEEKLEERGGEHDAAIRKTSGEIWIDHEDVFCGVIEEGERQQAEKKATRESASREEETVKHVTVGREEQMTKVSGDESAEGQTEETRVRMQVVEESLEAIEDLLHTNMQQRLDEKETTLEKTSEVAEAIHGEAQYYVVSKENESKDKEKVSEQQSKQPSVALIKSSVKEVKEDRKHEEGSIIQGGIGRKLVISKHPKVFQVKAVPVVPPKPLHCKLTALTLQQQLLQRERRDGDRWKENSAKVPTDHDTVCAEDLGRDGEEARGATEKPTLKGGEKEREKMRDGEERAASRNSPLSMCFDEAVAIATMRREKEKECEKERQREWGNEVQ